jgi:multisubunit Na+/H+ antiporter MnhB subunit
MTEAIMLLTSLILVYLIYKINKNTESILKSPQRFLVYYLAGYGITLLFFSSQNGLCIFYSNSSI